MLFIFSKLGNVDIDVILNVTKLKKKDCLKTISDVAAVFTNNQGEGDWSDFCKVKHSGEK